MKENISKQFFWNIRGCIAKVLDLKNEWSVPDDFYTNFVDRICYYKYPRAFDPRDTLIGSFKHYFKDLQHQIELQENVIPFNNLCGRDVNLHDFKNNNYYFYEQLTRNNNLIEFFRMFYHRYLLNAVYRFCKGLDIFEFFYEDYMKDYVKLANSNNFLNHSSCDAVILPLESAIYNLLKDRRVLDEMLSDICQFVKTDSKNVYFTDNFDYKKSKIKLSTLLKDWKIDGGIIHADDKLTDFLMICMTINALVSVLVYGVVTSFNIGEKLIEDESLRLLSGDINLYFTRYTTNILTNISILKEFASLKKQYEEQWNKLTNGCEPDDDTLENFYFTSVKLLKCLTPVSEYYFSCSKGVPDADNTMNLIRTIIETDNRVFKAGKTDLFIHEKVFIEEFREDEKIREKVTDKVYYENHMILFSLINDEVKRLINVVHNKLNFNISDWIFEQIGERLMLRKGNSFILPSFFFEYYYDKSTYL